MAMKYYPFCNETNIIWHQSRHALINQHNEGGYITYHKQIKTVSYNLLNIS